MNKKYIIEVATNKASLEKLKSDLSNAIQAPLDEAANGGRIKGLTRSEKAAIKNDLSTLFGVAEHQADALRQMVQGIVPSDTKGITEMKNQLQATMEFATGILQKMQQIGGSTDWMKQGISFVDDFSKMQSGLTETQGVVKGLEKSVSDLTQSFNVFKDALAVTNSEAFLKRFGNSTRSEAEDLARATKELEKIAKTRNKALQMAVNQGQTESVDFTGFSREDIEEEYKTSMEIIRDANKEIERLRNKYKKNTSGLYKDTEYIDQIGTISSEINRIKNMPGLDMGNIGSGLKASLKEATDSVKSAGNEIKNIIKSIQGKGLELAITLPDASSTEFASKINAFVQQASEQFNKNPVKINVDLANPFKVGNGGDAIKELTKKQKELSDAAAKAYMANAEKSGNEVDQSGLAGLYSPDTAKVSRNILNAFNNIYQIITAGQNNINAATKAWRTKMAEDLTVKPKFDASRAKEELRQTMSELQDILDTNELDVYTDTEALVNEIQEALTKNEFKVNIKAGNIDGSGATLNLDNVKMTSGERVSQGGVPFIPQQMAAAGEQKTSGVIREQTASITENSTAVSDSTDAQKVLKDAISKLNEDIIANKTRSKVLSSSVGNLTGEQRIQKIEQNIADIYKRGSVIGERKNEITQLISEGTDPAIISSLRSEFTELENEWNSLYNYISKLQKRKETIERQLESGTYESDGVSGQKNRDAANKQNQKRIDAIQSILDNEKRPVQLIIDELNKFWSKVNSKIEKATNDNDKAALETWKARAASMVTKGLGVITEDGKYALPDATAIENVLKGYPSLASTLSSDALLKTLSPIKELMYFIPEVQKTLGVMPQTEKEYIDEKTLQSRFQEILKINRYIEVARGLLSEKDVDINPNSIQEFIEYFGHIPEMANAIELARQYLEKVNALPKELWASEKQDTYLDQIKNVWSSTSDDAKSVFLNALNQSDAVNGKQVTQINDWDKIYGTVLSAYSENNSALKELQTNNPQLEQILAILERSSLLNSTKAAANQFGERGMMSALYGLQKSELVGNREFAKNPIHITTYGRGNKERVFELNAGSARQSADRSFNYSPKSLSKLFDKSVISGEIDEIMTAMFDPVIMAKDRLEAKIKELKSQISTMESSPDNLNAESLAAKKQELAVSEQQLAEIKSRANAIERTVQTLIDNLFASGKIKITAGKTADVPKWAESYQYDKTKLASYEKTGDFPERFNALKAELAQLKAGQYSADILKELEGLSDADKAQRVNEIISEKEIILNKLTQEIIQSLAVLAEDVTRADAKSSKSRKESKQRARKAERVVDDTQFDYQNSVKKQRDAIVNKDYYLSNLLSNIDFADQNGLMDVSVLKDVAEVYRDKLAKAKSMPSRSSATTDQARAEIDQAWSEMENARKILLDTYFGTDGWNVTRVLNDQFSAIDGELMRKEQSIQAAASDPQQAVNAQMSEIADKEAKAKQDADNYAEKLYYKYIVEPQEKIQSELRNRSAEIKAKEKYTQDAKNNLESLADRDKDLAQLKTELYNQMQKDPRFVELNRLRQSVDVGSQEHKDYTNAIKEIENKYTAPYAQARAEWIKSKAAALDAEYAAFVQSIRDEAIGDAAKSARAEFRAETGSNVRSVSGMERVIEEIRQTAYKEAEAATMQAIANVDQSAVIPQAEVERQLEEARAQADVKKAEALLRMRGKTDAELMADIHTTASTNDAEQSKVYSAEEQEKRNQLENKMAIYGITKDMLDAERRQTQLEQERVAETRNAESAAQANTSAMQSTGGDSARYGGGYVAAIDTSDLAKEGTLRGIYELLNGGAPRGGWNDSISESSKTRGNASGNTGIMTAGIKEQLDDVGRKIAETVTKQTKLLSIPNGELNATTARQLSKNINSIRGKQDGGSALAGALNSLYYLGFTSDEGYTFKQEDSAKLAKAYSQIKNGMMGTIVKQLDDGVQAYIITLQRQLEDVARANNLDYDAINKAANSAGVSQKAKVTKKKINAAGAKDITPQHTSNTNASNTADNQSGIPGLLNQIAKETTLQGILRKLSGGIKVTSNSQGGKTGGSKDEKKTVLSSDQMRQALLDEARKLYPEYTSKKMRPLANGMAMDVFLPYSGEDRQKEIEDTQARINALQEQGLSNTNEWILAEQKLNALKAEQEKITIRINNDGQITTKSSFQNFAVGTEAAHKELQNVQQMMQAIHDTGTLSFTNDGQLQSFNLVIQNLLNAVRDLNNYKSQLNQSDLFTPESEANLSRYALGIQNARKEVMSLLDAVHKYNNGQKVNANIDTLPGGIAGRSDSQIKAAMQDIITQNNSAIASFGDLKQVTNDYGEVASYQLTYTLRTGKREVQDMTLVLNPLTNELRVQKGAVKEVATGWDKFWGGLKGKFASISQYIVSMGSIHRIFSMIKQGFQYVKEIDSALTELKKVTDETDASYEKFLNNMSRTGSVIGATVASLTTMAAEWARLGYSMKEAAQLAESTAVLLNVSEFQDGSAATEALISTMQAFQYTADESMHVVDILNEVGNNYSVSSDGIATALQDSAAALMEAGNDLEQSVALVAAANKVVQDPNSVGSALRTISLRLRGTSVKVLEEMGEETEGVVESVSKMQAKIKALTGVNILTDSGAYKDTYTILNEIGTVWEDMSDIDQAALLELMAGKNRANTLAAILGNMEDLEGAYKSALNSEGSALRENEEYLNSIQGHIDVLKNETQSMWKNFMSADSAKWVVHFLELVVKLVDQFGLLNSAIVLFGTRLMSKNYNDLFGGLPTIKLGALKDKIFKKKSGDSNAQSAADAEVVADQQAGASDDAEAQREIANSEQKTEKKISDAQEVANAEVVADQQAAASSSAEAQEEIANSEQKTQEQIANAQQVAAAENAAAAQSAAGWKKTWGSIKNTVKSFLIMTAITKVVDGIMSAITSIDTSSPFEKAQDEYTELSSRLAECESELGSLESQLESTNQQIEEMMSLGTLSFVEQEELKRLKEVSAELERQISMTETLQSSLAAGVASSAINAGGSYLDTSFMSEKSKAERQEEAAEETGSGWGIAAAIVAAIAAAAITVATAGTGAPVGATILAAGTSAATAGGAGYIAGNAAGSAYGAYKEGQAYDSETTVQEAIDQMNWARDILVKARDEAYEAYTKNPLDENALKNFETASNELLKYDQQMGTHIGNLSQYYNAIMSSWSNMTDEQKEQNGAMLAQAQIYGDMIDKYNIEMGGKDAKANAIDRIFGENADDQLKSVKKRLMEMAAAGEEIDLKKAFGGDTAAYDAFVDRLYNMGMYVYECEDAFQAMYEAEVKASQVDFSDIVSDVLSVAGAISGLKDAFEEFLQSGFLSLDTASSLGDYFDTTTLKEAYEKYLSVMLTGNASISEAKEATEALAHTYMQEKITLGELSAEQKALYVALFKRMGIANAEDFVKKELEQSGINKVQEILDKFFAREDLKTFFNVANLGEVVMAYYPELQDIIKQYELEEDVIDRLIIKLKEKRDLEENINTAQSQKNNYDAFFNGENDKKGYKQLKLDIEKKKRDIENIYKKYSRDALETTLLGGEYGKYTIFRGWEAYRDGEYIAVSTEERNFIKEQQAAFMKEYGLPYFTYMQKMEEELAQYESEYQQLIADGIAKGYLNDDGSIKEGVEEGYVQALDVAKKALEKVEAEIDSEFTINYELEFTEDLKDNTISGLTAALEEYQAAMRATEEVITDGQVVSEEYKQSLLDMGISVFDLSKCFDETNPLVVKNAKALRELVNVSKASVVQNSKLARSQAMLQYYEMYKKMQKYISATGDIIDDKNDEVAAIYDEMGALSKAISQYAMLEVQLLGAVDAYEKFQEAQEADSQTDYIGNTEGMVQALGDAFNTGKLGTETARAAIEGLVPTSVYEDLDTVDAKMAAIYDYFKNGKIAQYFDLEFDDNGAITSAEMKLGNLRKFIEDGLWGDNNEDGINVFAGSDWQHFEFSDEFLAGLEDADDKLQYFADQMDVTKDVAFAFIKSLEDHDIEWLNGDYYGLFEDLLPKTLEGDIYKATSAIAELNAKLASGEIDATEYSEQFKLLTAELNKTKEASRINMFGEDGIYDNTDDADGYFEANEKAVAATEDLNKATKAYRIALEAVTKAQEEGREPTEAELKALKNTEKAADEATAAYIEVVKQREKFAKPTESEISIILTDIEDEIAAAGDKFDAAIKNSFALDENGYYVIQAGIDISDLEARYPGIEKHVNLLNSRTQLKAYADTGEAEASLQTINDTLVTIQKILEHVFKVEVDADGAVKDVNEFKGVWDSIKSKSVELWTSIMSRKESNSNNEPLAPNERTQSTHVNGTAHASGNWGLPSSEHNSLVGELGPEMVVDPQSGRYYTVGDNGAEMVDLPKGAIIFNHKQTEGLLKNGYVTSRGKAYASGNAHLTLYPNASSQGQWDGTGYSSWDDTTYNLQEALDDAAGSVSEFEETIDWIAIRMEEHEETIGKLNAELENQFDYISKNKKIAELIGANESKLVDLKSAGDYYNNKAESYLVGLDQKLVNAARNGEIAISDFTNEEDKNTIDAINKYREYAKLAADKYTEYENTVAEIRNLATQRIDNARNTGDVKAAVEASQTEKLQNAIDFDEARGEITDPSYYAAMMENSKTTVKYLTTAKKAMQAEFDKAVEDGMLEVGSDAWYEELNKLYEIDSEIASANKELEEFQNAINEIYWSGFDEVINRFDYLSDEANGLIDVMSELDMVSKPDTEDGWGASDVEWTKEGLATLGLHAQEMERAEEKSKMYANAIADLKKEYNDGHYSESEYYEKLNELTQGQYDAIKAAQAEKEAIVDLNKQRVDAIKEGIEKEIDAYKKLIEAKKEELSAEKDLHDFQKDSMEQQKNIAEIERKLAALANDNSMSAVAKKRQLEAELAEAKAEQEELYYDRSIENQQNALDKELEDFQEQKDAEIEQWDKYLENVEAIVTESLGIVKQNADDIGATLTEKTTEYGLTVSDAILNPWKDGASAISDYTTIFGDATSSTTEQLEGIRSKWEEIKDELKEANAEADKYYDKTAATADGPSVADINTENAEYANAKKKQAPKPDPKPTVVEQPDNKPEPPSLNVGSYVEVKSGTKWYNDSYGGGPSGSAKSGKIAYVNTKGSHAYNIDGLGWIKKTDIVGYAKGSTGVSKDQLAILHELGDELSLVAGPNGRLQYITKGTAIIPHDISENLMQLGQLDPSEVLNRNRPTIAPNKSVVNNTTEISIDASVGTLLHVEHLDGNNPNEVLKIVDKAWEKKMQGLNNNIRKLVR